MVVYLFLLSLLLLLLLLLLLEAIFYQNANAGIIELKFYEQSKNEPTLRLNAKKAFPLITSCIYYYLRIPHNDSLYPSNFVFNYTSGWTAYILPRTFENNYNSCKFWWKKYVI